MWMTPRPADTDPFRYVISLKISKQDLDDLNRSFKPAIELINPETPYDYNTRALPKFRQTFNNTVEFTDLIHKTAAGLKKYHSNKKPSQKKIKELYDKSKNLFIKEFKSIQYAEITPQIISGNNEYDKAFFKQLDILENKVLDGQSATGDLKIRGPQDPFTAGGVIGLYYNKMMDKVGQSCK